MRESLGKNRRSTVMQISGSLPVEQLSAEFAETGHVVVTDPFPADRVDEIARAVGAPRPLRRAPLPSEHIAGQTYMFYEKAVSAHPACERDCAPLCALVEATTAGAVLGLVRRITGIPRLTARIVSVRQYVKGSHVERAAPRTPGILVMWCATQGWSKERGGNLVFVDGACAEMQYGSLYVCRDVVDGTAGAAIDLVKDHGPLVVFHAVLS